MVSSFDFQAACEDLFNSREIQNWLQAWSLPCKQCLLLIGRSGMQLVGAFLPWPYAFSDSRMTSVALPWRFHRCVRDIRSFILYSLTSSGLQLPKMTIKDSSHLVFFRFSQYWHDWSKFHQLSFPVIAPFHLSLMPANSKNCRLIG